MTLVCPLLRSSMKSAISLQYPVRATIATLNTMRMERFIQPDLHQVVLGNIRTLEKTAKVRPKNRLCTTRICTACAIGRKCLLRKSAMRPFLFTIPIRLIPQLFQQMVSMGIHLGLRAKLLLLCEVIASLQQTNIVPSSRTGTQC